MTQRPEFRHEKEETELSLTTRSPPDSSDSESPVRSNYNSKINYLSKETELDNSAKTNQVKSNYIPAGRSCS